MAKLWKVVLLVLSICSVEKILGMPICSDAENKRNVFIFSGVIGSDTLDTEIDLPKYVTITNSSLKTISAKTFNGPKYIAEISLIGIQLEKIQPQTFDKFETLRSINLSFNNLTTINDDTFNRLNNLKSLNVSNNKISSIENLSNPIIETLDLSHNQIGFFLSEQMTNLKYLDLSYNKIASVFDNNSKKSKLLQLNLQHNNIAEIDKNAFDHQNTLVELNLSHNQLESVDLDKLENLKILLLNDNKISNIATLGHLYMLVTLNLANNKIEEITIDTFIGMKSLKQLNLASNNLKAIGELAFQNTPVLSELNLQNNLIDNLRMRDFHQITELKVISIDNNKFDCLNLSKLLMGFAEIKVSVKYGDDNDVHSIHGIACINIPTTTITQEPYFEHKANDNHEEQLNNIAVLLQQLEEMHKLDETRTNELFSIHVLLYPIIGILVFIAAVTLAKRYYKQIN